jgi:hypothetical protein
MRTGRLICLPIVLAGLLCGCAGVDRRPAGGPPAAAGPQRSEVERDRADLLRELSLYSD